MAAHPAPQIPDHQLLRCIGKGSYGEVWLARSVTGTFRAVKIVHRSSFDHARPYEREFVGIQKFEPVSRTHETQVDILHVGRNDAEGYFYYIMELADDPVTGQEIEPESYKPWSLRSDLYELGRLPIQECLDIGLHLAAALDHIHKNGLVHRDVKPSNIIYINRVPKLADVGLVTSSEATRSFVGTEGYIPPEGPGSPQADIYSLGKVLYEISTGRNRLDFPELPTFLKDSPEKEALVQLNELVLKACEEDPKRRYQTAEAMLADLQKLKSGKLLRRIQPRFGAKKLLIAILAAGVLLSSFYFHYWWIKDNAPAPQRESAGNSVGAAAVAGAPPAVASAEQTSNAPAPPVVRNGEDESWTFTTIAGEAGSSGSTDGVGSEARFNGPNGIAVDNEGNLYVADWGNNTIRLIKPSGVVSTLAGLTGTYGSSDGLGANARFRHARKIAMDRSGNAYVTDCGNNTIRKITPEGMVTTLAGQAGSIGSADGPAVIARFNCSDGLAVAPDGNIFVADGGNFTIRKITPLGLVSTVAGQVGVSGSSDGPGPEARFSGPKAQFPGRIELAVGARGFIYVTDAYNHTIRVINPSGVVSTLAGQTGVAGSADGLTTRARFNSPLGIAVDGEGNLYVADFLNNTIRKITSAGAVTTIGGLAGSSGSSDGLGAVARFNKPIGLALDTQGNIYVLDAGNNTIRKGHR